MHLETFKYYLSFDLLSLNLKRAQFDIL